MRFLNWILLSPYSRMAGIPGIQGITMLRNMLRIVCLSDTHGKLRQIPKIPDGDVLIHAGDFSSTGTLEELVDFREFINGLPHKQKVVIAGNHDITLDKDYYIDRGANRFHRRMGKTSVEVLEEYSNKCRAAICENSPGYTYLEDNHCFLGNPLDGNSILTHGAPWQPEFCDWAFNLHIGEALKAKWDQIPSETDVLITHGPPLGVLDLADSGHRCGCPDLHNAVKERIKPRLHVFGHIHEGYGTHFDGQTLFVNASNCTLRYRCTNVPVVVDLPFDITQPAQIVTEF